MGYLGEILSSTNLPDRHHQLTAETLPFIRSVSVADQRRVFDFGPVGIRGPRFDDAKDSVPRLPAPGRLGRASDESDALVDQYQDLMTDANRVDLEFILRYGFTDAVAIYNYVQEVGYKKYPAIVGAFAKIGAQPFVIVGTQPSYQLMGDTVIKRPSNPAPEDFFFMERILSWRRLRRRFSESCASSTYERRMAACTRSTVTKGLSSSGMISSMSPRSSWS